MLRLPERLVAGDNIGRLQVALIKLAAVQALHDHKFRLEFTSAAHQAHFDRQSLDFRGVNISLSPAHE